MALHLSVVLFCSNLEDIRNVVVVIFYIIIYTLNTIYVI